MSVTKPALDSAELKDFRRDTENALYEKWRQGEDRFTVEAELRAILTSHAQAVMYSILRKADPDLLTEAVDRVMLNLTRFRGGSLFTTWVHRIMMGVMYDQRRVERRRKEVSASTPGFDLVGTSSPGATDVMLTVRQILNEEDFTVFEQIAVLGRTHGEAAESLSLSKATLTRKWERITRTLRHAFTKRFPPRR